MDDPNTPKHPIWYEPHPVSVERKAAIRALGFRIIDAEFKPDGEENPDVPELSAPEGAKKPDQMKVDELKAALTAKGISIPEGAKKPDLVALLEQAD